MLDDLGREDQDLVVLSLKRLMDYSNGIADFGSFGYLQQWETEIWSIALML